MSKTDNPFKRAQAASSAARAVGQVVVVGGASALPNSAAAKQAAAFLLCATLSIARSRNTAHSLFDLRFGISDITGMQAYVIDNFGKAKSDKVVLDALPKVICFNCGKVRASHYLSMLPFFMPLIPDCDQCASQRQTVYQHEQRKSLCSYTNDLLFISYSLPIREAYKKLLAGLPTYEETLK